MLPVCLQHRAREGGEGSADPGRQPHQPLQVRSPERTEEGGEAQGWRRATAVQVGALRAGWWVVVRVAPFLVLESLLHLRTTPAPRLARARADLLNQYLPMRVRLDPLLDFVVHAPLDPGEGTAPRGNSPCDRLQGQSATEITKVMAGCSVPGGPTAPRVQHEKPFSMPANSGHKPWTPSQGNPPNCAWNLGADVML